MAAHCGRTSLNSVALGDKARDNSRRMRKMPEISETIRKGSDLSTSSSEESKKSPKAVMGKMDQRILMKVSCTVRP